MSTGGPPLPTADKEAAEIQRLLKNITPQEIRQLRMNIHAEQQAPQHTPAPASSEASGAPDGTGETPDLRRRLEEDYEADANAGAEEAPNITNDGEGHSAADPSNSGSGTGTA